MVFGLIGGILLLLAGTTLSVFAPRIGRWLSSARATYQSEMKKIRGQECTSCVSSWNKTALRFGQIFDIWLIRIIGIAFVVGAIYLFYAVLSRL
ncbi:MAG: hypothetical protein C4555_04855 [Dehalococcoidia bacterium]|jgi:hypothetical protein|nr:MAG: hypothetical protein C4555_04855 [Dehalococcoidia bacterium]